MDRHLAQPRFLKVEELLVDGVDLLVLHILLLKVRVCKVEERTGAQHPAYCPLIQLASLRGRDQLYLKNFPPFQTKNKSEIRAMLWRANICYKGREKER